MEVVEVEPLMLKYDDENDVKRDAYDMMMSQARLSKTKLMKKEPKPIKRLKSKTKTQHQSTNINKQGRLTGYLLKTRIKTGINLSCEKVKYKVKIESSIQSTPE